MNVIGHDAVREELERELAPATLLLGPSGTGKGFLAYRAATHHGVHTSCISYIAKLGAPEAREAVSLAQSAPPGRLRVFIIDLDGATEQAQNILLKILEEPPEPVRFLLVASRRPLVTVMSRCRVLRTGLLSDEQVAEVLAGLGVPEKHAPAGAGTVAGAVAASKADPEEAKRLKGAVAAAVRFGAAGDFESMHAAVRSWTSQHCAVLLAWSAEAASGRWDRFSPDFAAGASRGQAVAVWNIMRTSSVSPVTAAVALATAFRKE